MVDKAMRYAYEVYKEKSFSQAAKNLYVSQPALSLAIRKLEDRLGLQIFDRSTTPVSLTAEGQVYIDTAQRILRLSEQLESYMDDRRRLHTGRITVGAPHLFIVHLLPGIIGQFTENYSQVDFSLLEGDTVQLREMMLEDEIDLILDTTEYEPELMVQYKVLDETILLAVPAANKLNRKLARYALSLEDVQTGRFLEERFAPVPLESFREERFLMQRKGQDMHSRSLALCRACGFEPKSYLHLNQLVTALDLTRQNRGLTFVSDTSVKTLASGEGLVFYKLAGEITKRKVYISHRKNRYVSLAMQKFIKLTAGHMTPAEGP